MSWESIQTSARLLDTLGSSIANDTPWEASHKGLVEPLTELRSTEIVTEETS